jgi:hypothetical protein
LENPPLSRVVHRICRYYLGGKFDKDERNEKEKRRKREENVKN